MRILITRPEPGASRSAERLRAAGHQVVVAPLSRIVLDADTPLLGDADALLLTSANAGRALALYPAIARDLPVYAVGAATAAAATAAGFTKVETSDGDGEKLVKSILDLGLERPRRIAYLSGDVIRADLGAQLAAGGVACDRHIVYRTEAEARLPHAAAAALQGGALDAALFYSPRGAAWFGEKVRGEGLLDALSRLSACALSAAVAKDLRPLGFKAIIVADKPDEAALLQALEEVALPQGPVSDALDRPRPLAVRRLFGWFLPWLLLLFVAAFLVGIYWSPLLHARLASDMPWLFAAADTPPAPAIDEAARAGIDRLEAQLSAHIAEPAPAAPSAPAPLSLMPDDQLAALNAEIAALKARLDQRDKTSKSQLATGVALMAVRQIERTLASGRPYQDDLADLAPRVLGNAEAAAALDALSPYAETGLTRYPVLEQTLRVKGQDWLTAIQIDAARGWWQRALARAQSLVQIRRPGDAAGTGPQAALARAEQALAGRDLAAAIREVETLPQPGRKAATPWLREARARLAADQALEQLEQALLAPAAAGRDN